MLVLTLVQIADISAIAIASQSYGYGDATVTHMRRAKVHLRMYAKHQYNTRVRVRKYVITYIPTQNYKYSIIIDCAIILHNYYIIGRRKNRL